MLKLDLLSCGLATLKIRRERSQPAITCPKLTIETLKQGVKYVQSYQ